MTTPTIEEIVEIMKRTDNLDAGLREMCETYGDVTITLFSVPANGLTGKLRAILADETRMMTASGELMFTKTGEAFNAPKERIYAINPSHVHAHYLGEYTIGTPKAPLRDP